MRCLLAVVFFVTVATADDAEFDEAKKVFFKNIGRPPLGVRIGGIFALAQTGEPRALEMLAQRYGRPMAPKDHERYLIAWCGGRGFTGPEHVEGLWKWARRRNRDDDAWLQFQALRACARHGEVERVSAWARDRRPGPFGRAAALEALAAAQAPGSVELAADLLASPSRAPVDRALLVEGCAQILLAHAEDRSEEAYSTCVERLLDLMSGDTLTERTKLVVARRLARAYGSRVTTDVAYLRKLAGFAAVGEQTGPTRTFRPKFAGVEGTGTRIAYLIDLSDSMLGPLSAAARRGSKAEASVLSRFDLARNYLARALGELPEGAWFTVIGFGSKARMFKSTPGLVRATRERVAAALAELRAIEPGPAKEGRPHGVLRGATNLHGALLRAFRARPGGMVRRAEHVDGKVLLSGCDTLFLLSDGKPNEDDFAVLDHSKGTEYKSDTETGETRKGRAGMYRFYGPYVMPFYLVADVERLNLFRKVEIHCVGLGEADNELLKTLAALGLGEHRTLEAAR